MGAHTLAHLLRGTRKRPTVSKPKGKPTISFNVSDNIEREKSLGFKKWHQSVLSDEEEMNRSLL